MLMNKYNNIIQFITDSYTKIGKCGETYNEQIQYYNIIQKWFFYDINSPYEARCPPISVSILTNLIYLIPIRKVRSDLNFFNGIKRKVRMRCSKMHPQDLTLSSLNLPLSSSYTTRSELLLQFWICSEWRWPKVGGKWKKYLIGNKVIFQRCKMMLVCVVRI